MIRSINEHLVKDNEPNIQFLSDYDHEKLDRADDNPLIQMSSFDKSIPFIVVPDGGVIADITANNPNTILKNLQMSINLDHQIGAGVIEVHHGNKTLLFRQVLSRIFEKRWRVDDIASALQTELNLYYPGYQIRSR
jgi:hypothetical protein